VSATEDNAAEPVSTSEDSDEYDDVEVNDSAEIINPVITAGSADDVAVTAYFPEHPDRKIPIGQPVDLIVGLHNKGGVDFNITMMTAQLRSKYDWSFLVRNFSVSHVGQMLPAGSQISHTYRFITDNRLDPVDVILTGYALYNNTFGNDFESVFYNNTISLVDTSSGFDLTTILTYLMIVGALAGVVFGVVKLAGGKKKRGSSGAASSEQGSSSSWEEGLLSTSSSKKADKNKASKKKN